MARNFILANSDKLQVASVPLSAVPLTLACWFKPVSAAVAYALVVISNADGTQRFYLSTDGAGHVLGTPRNAGTSGSAISGTTYSAGVWSFACATFTNATLRDAQVNNGAAGTNATNVTPTTPNVLTALGFSGSTTFFNGDLAEVSIYNAVLSAADKTALYSGGPGGIGLDARYVQPASLVAYWKLGLDGSLTDVVASRVLTATGTTAVAGPSIFAYPVAPAAGRQAILAGFPTPVFINESGTRQAIAGSVMLDETVASGGGGGVFHDAWRRVALKIHQMGL